MQSTSRLWMIALTAASLAAAPVAQAQTQSPSAPQSTEQGSKVAPKEIPDSKLDAAAAAVKHVSAVSNTYQQKLAQAPVADKERITAEADEALVKAVTDQGLSIDEFTTIMELVQADPAVRDKLMQRLKN